MFFMELIFEVAQYETFFENNIILRETSLLGIAPLLLSIDSISLKLCKLGMHTDL